MKSKIDYLIGKSSTENAVMIGTANICGRPCYLYNPILFQKCPKCKGKVNENFENDYTIEKYWEHEVLKERKKYNENNICTGFTWNKNIGKEDVEEEAMFKYFDKVDNEKKIHLTIKYANTESIIKKYMGKDDPESRKMYLKEFQEAEV